MTCTTFRSDCRSCPVHEECLYFHVSERNRDPGAPLRLQSPTRPHVLDTASQPIPRQLGPGSRFAFSLVLMGRALTHVPYFAVAVRQAGHFHGLGRSHGRFDVVGFHCRDGEGRLHSLRGSGTGVLSWGRLRRVKVRPEPWDAARRLELQTLSPLQMVSGGRLIQRFDPEIFTVRLVERLERLSWFHEEVRCRWDYGSFRRMARKVRVESCDFRPVKSWRNTRRGRRRIPMNGIVGKARLSNVSPSWPGYGGRRRSSTPGRTPASSSARCGWKRRRVNRSKVVWSVHPGALSLRVGQAPLKARNSDADSGTVSPCRAGPPKEPCLSFSKPRLTKAKRFASNSFGRAIDESSLARRVGQSLSEEPSITKSPGPIKSPRFCFTLRSSVQPATGILPVAGWTEFTELNGGFLSCVDLSTGSDRSQIAVSESPLAAASDHPCATAFPGRPGRWSGMGRAPLQAQVRSQEAKTVDLTNRAGTRWRCTDRPPEPCRTL